MIHEDDFTSYTICEIPEECIATCSSDDIAFVTDSMYCKCLNYSVYSSYPITKPRMSTGVFGNLTKIGKHVDYLKTFFM